MAQTPGVRRAQLLVHAQAAALELEPDGAGIELVHGRLAPRGQHHVARPSPSRRPTPPGRARRGRAPGGCRPPTGDELHAVALQGVRRSSRRPRAPPRPAASRAGRRASPPRRAARSACANSTPIGPPPTITTERGSSLQADQLVRGDERRRRRDPGVAAAPGRAPVARITGTPSSSRSPIDQPARRGSAPARARRGTPSCLRT